MNYSNKDVIKVVITLLLLCIPIFAHLDSFPIRAWDEGRYAVNAMEMYYDGDYIVPHFNGRPEMWNTKPPIMLWMQVFFMKILGPTELAVRLPSAFAALFTCLLLLAIISRYFKDYMFGFLTVIVLITSGGFVYFHTSRTGDFDSLLTFFTTLYCLLFYTYMETKKTKYLYGFFVSLALAMLTKSVTGTLFLPGIFIYVVWQKQLVRLIKNKHTYIGIGIVLVMVLSYYFIREAQNPGYIQAVKDNELGGRFLKTLEGNQGSYLFYINHLYTKFFKHWLVFLPIGLIIGLFNNNSRIQKFTKYIGILTLSFLLVITYSKTKLHWYTLPILPFMAIMVAIFLNFIFTSLKHINYANLYAGNNLIKKSAPVLFIFLILLTPYTTLLKKVYSPTLPDHNRWVYMLGTFLREATKGKRDLDGYYVLYDGFRQHNTFYVEILQKQGVNIDFKNWEELDVGDTVIAHQSLVKNYVTLNYDYEILEKYENLLTYRINGIK